MTDERASHRQRITDEREKTFLFSKLHNMPLAYMRSREKAPGDANWANAKFDGEKLEWWATGRDGLDENAGFVFRNSAILDLDDDSEGSLFLQAFDAAWKHYCLGVDHVSFGRECNIAPRHRLIAITVGEKDGLRKAISKINRNLDLRMPDGSGYHLGFEVRGLGGPKQTVAPGSIYTHDIRKSAQPSWGDEDLLRWFKEPTGRALKEITSIDEVRSVLKAYHAACVATYLALNWAEGARHRCALATAGMIRQAIDLLMERGSPDPGCYLQTLEDGFDFAETVISIVLQLAGDNDEKKSRLLAVKTTFRKDVEQQRVASRRIFVDALGEAEGDIVYTMLKRCLNLTVFPPDFEDAIERYWYRDGSGFVDMKARRSMINDDFINFNETEYNPEQLRIKLANVRERVGNKNVTAYQVMVESRARNEYSGDRFDPTKTPGDVFESVTGRKYWNTWLGLRGRDLGPIPDEHEIVKAARHVIGPAIGDPTGEKGYVDYLIATYAYVIQNPGVRWTPGIIIHGVGGSGKTFIVEGLLFSMFRNPNAVKMRGVDIESRFNSSLKMAVVVHVDELEGLPVAQGYAAIKSLTGSSKLKIEAKGKDTEEVDNRISFFSLNTNANSVGPLFKSDNAFERRFTIFKSEPLDRPAQLEIQDKIGKLAQTIGIHEMKRMNLPNAEENFNIWYSYLLNKRIDPQFVRNTLETDALRDARAERTDFSQDFLLHVWRAKGMARPGEWPEGGSVYSPFMFSDQHLKLGIDQYFKGHPQWRLDAIFKDVLICIRDLHALGDYPESGNRGKWRTKEPPRTYLWSLGDKQQFVKAFLRKFGVDISTEEYTEEDMRKVFSVHFETRI